MKLTLLVGPPGSGKSTHCQEMQKNHNEAQIFRINQDEQGKDQHFYNFQAGIEDKDHIVVDRMNFNKKQRDRYLKPAKEAGYETEIVVLHENKETCLKRCLDRINNEGHPTVKTEEDAHKALNFFFTHYERVQDNEADIVTRIWPDVKNLAPCIVSDIDNTLSDSNHRQVLLDNNGGKKNWKGFFDAMDKDPVNEWCQDILRTMRPGNIIVLCSGRPDNYRTITKTWLEDNKVHYDHLFMRSRSDSRPDTVVKELILEFEIKTRFKNVKFWLDDRKCVIDKIREHGIMVLDCAGPKGDF